MSTSTLFSTAQLEALVAQARTVLPAAVNGRLDKAVRLVRSASVTVHADGSATVLSETDGLTGYLVQHGRCTCPDFQFQPPEVEGWCCHRIARALTLRLQPPPPAPIDVTPTAVPSGPELPLPEAPASVNMRLIVAGREV